MVGAVLVADALLVRNEEVIVPVPASEFDVFPNFDVAVGANHR
jgi:hypothetical protein